MPYAWVNGKTNRYRDLTNGQWVSRDTVLGLVQRSIDTSTGVVDNLVSMYSGGSLAPKDFARLFWGELRAEYIRQYMSGIGGKQMMTQADWGAVGGMLKEQKKYFDPFMAELPNLSEGQIRARAAMYINSAREAHERAHAKSAKKWGADEVHWWLGPVKTEHCTRCPVWESMGWQPIGKKGGFPTTDGESFPGDGKTCDGLVNCKCRLSYRNSKTSQEYMG